MEFLQSPKYVPAPDCPGTFGGAPANRFMSLIVLALRFERLYDHNRAGNVFIFILNEI